MTEPTVPASSLAELLAGRVISDPLVAATYGVDATPGSSAPDHFEVVRARDRGDVVDVLRYAAEHRIPVVPQGARTGLVGAAGALEGAIVLNVEAMVEMSIDAEQRQAVLGPGVVNADLKAAVRAHGLAYPPDPASADSCTIGGNVATNAGGLCCVKYGVTADYIRGLEVVLAGGEVIRTGRRTAKGVTGLDLTGLFVGSEGTLGVITEVVARLVPAADAPLTVLAVFPDLATTMAGVAALRAQRHTPSLVELLDGPGVEAIQDYADFGYPRGVGAVLLVQSDRVGGTHEDVQAYAAALQAAGADEVAVADDAQESELLLAGRRALNPAMEAVGRRLIEDVCVPVARLGELVEAVHAIADRRGLRAMASGHAGDGNLHPVFFYDPDDEASTAAAAAAFDDLVTVAWALGGTLAGEHGVGSTKAPWLVGELGAAEVARQRAVKAVFDPLGIMNPGRVFP